MHTSYLPTGQRSRLKEAIQMQISSDIKPQEAASSFYLSVLRTLVWFRFQGAFLVRLLTFVVSLYSFFLTSVVWVS